MVYKPGLPDLAPAICVRLRFLFSLLSGAGVLSCFCPLFQQPLKLVRKLLNVRSAKTQNSLNLVLRPFFTMQS
jgi:hypothetical protein